MDETLESVISTSFTNLLKAWVQYQPFRCDRHYYPMELSFITPLIGPLICALAAGNHAMIKISSSSSELWSFEKAPLKPSHKNLVS